MKTASATYPKKIARTDQEKIHLILFFNKKKTWKFVTEANLRPFSEENDSIYLEKARNIFIESYGNGIFKAYKRAKTLFGQAKLAEKKKKNFFKSLFNLNKI